MAKEPRGRNENGYVIHPEREAGSDRSVWPINWLFIILAFLASFGIVFTIGWYFVHRFIGVSLSPWVLAVMAFLGASLVVGLRPR